MLKYLAAWLLALPYVAHAAEDPNELVIRRGDTIVNLADVDAYVSRVPKDLRQHFIDSPERIRDMLNNLLLSKQLAAQARAEQLDRKPLVAAQLRVAQDEVLARVRMAEFIDSIKVPDLSELAREQYAAHKEIYKLPPQVDVKHLLISTEKRTDADAKALAEKVRTEALASPNAFDALIAKYSEDTSKAVNNGLMTDATDKKYVQEFRDAANTLTHAGEISPLVRTAFGYHVLQLVVRKPERQQSFDEVREQLTASMREQFISTQRRDFVNRLNSQKDEINPATLDTLRDRYDEAGNVKVATGQGQGGGKIPAPTPGPPPQKP